MLSRFSSAGSLPRSDHSDRRRSRQNIGAAAATVAAIAGVAVGASASPAFAAATHPSGPATPAAAVVALGGPDAGAPALAAPALGGTAPLAAPSLDNAALGKSAPLANPATGRTSIASPLAATGPVPAPSHPQPAKPSASPAAGGPSAPGPQQAGSNGQQSGTSGQSASAQQAAPQQPYQFYDSVLPEDIPAGQIVATYVTGPFAVSKAQVASRSKVMWIDTNATDPNADALDTEPGDATPAMAASWAYRKLKADPNSLACIYTALGEWAAVRAQTSALPAWMQSRIRWWIANPTGVQHLVPGSDATQWYWGSTYDISTAKTRL